MSHPDHESQGEWQACESGEIGRLVRHFHDRRRAVASQHRQVAVVLLLMVGLTGYYFIGVLPGAEPNYGGIVCSELMKLAPEYQANRLDAETADRIKEHLAHCQHCRQLMGSRMPQSETRSDRPFIPRISRRHSLAAQVRLAVR